MLILLGRHSFGRSLVRQLDFIRESLHAQVEVPKLIDWKILVLAHHVVTLTRYSVSIGKSNHRGWNRMYAIIIQSVLLHTGVIHAALQ